MLMPVLLKNERLGSLEDDNGSEFFCVTTRKFVVALLCCAALWNIVS
jgi:hypothetical protein